MVDLSSDLSLTFRMLLDTNAWRHRLVEQIELGSAEYFTVRRSYQIELSPELIDGFDVPPETETVRALVPLTTLPKAPLLSFDLIGPDGGRAALELRRSGAAVEAAYLASLARGEGLSRGLIDMALPESLLEAICAFTPDPFRRFLDLAGGDEALALTRYLADGLGFTPGPEALQHARRFSRWAGGHLVQALGEPADPLSSAENVLLALPLMGMAAPRTDGELLGLVSSFHGAVAVAAASGAGAFLATLAEYGRRWEALIELDLRHGSPTIVKMSDRRPLEPERGAPFKHGVEVAFDVAIGDAMSYHLAVGASDASLHLLKWRASTLEGETLSPAMLEGDKHTPELLTLYTSATDRPYFVRITTMIGVATSARWIPVVVAGLTVMSTLTALTGSADPDRLGALTVPTTFAVALLQLREQVTLVARIQRLWRNVMLMSLVVLWAVVLVRLFGE